VIFKPHTPRRAATPSALLHPDEAACSRSKLAVGSTQSELSAAQAGFAKYIIPNPVIASALALRAGVSVFVGGRGFLKAHA
jgi:hypothetical protein